MAGLRPRAWLQAARAVNADASIAAYSRLGSPVAPLTLVATLAALGLHTSLAP